VSKQALKRGIFGTAGKRKADSPRGLKASGRPLFRKALGFEDFAPTQSLLAASTKETKVAPQS
jgi:hypothetical protein